jgi:hypothetical protein
MRIPNKPCFRSTFNHVSLADLTALICAALAMKHINAPIDDCFLPGGCRASFAYATCLHDDLKAWTL